MTSRAGLRASSSCATNAGSAALSRVLDFSSAFPDVIDVDNAIEVSDAVSREPLAASSLSTFLRPGRSKPQCANSRGRCRGLSDIIIRAARVRPQQTSTPSSCRSCSPIPGRHLQALTPSSDPGRHPWGVLPSNASRILAQRAARWRRFGFVLRLHLRRHRPGMGGVTLWRALLAAIAEDLIDPPRFGSRETRPTPSPFLVAAWLHHQLVFPSRGSDPHALTITDITFFDDSTTAEAAHEKTTIALREVTVGINTK